MGVVFPSPPSPLVVKDPERALERARSPPSPPVEKDLEKDRRVAKDPARALERARSPPSPRAARALARAESPPSLVVWKAPDAASRNPSPPPSRRNLVAKEALNLRNRRVAKDLEKDLVVNAVWSNK